MITRTVLLVLLAAWALSALVSVNTASRFYCAEWGEMRWRGQPMALCKIVGTPTPAPGLR